MPDERPPGLSQISLCDKPVHRSFEPPAGSPAGAMLVATLLPSGSIALRMVKPGRRSKEDDASVELNLGELFSKSGTPKPKTSLDGFFSAVSDQLHITKFTGNEDKDSFKVKEIVTREWRNFCNPNQKKQEEEDEQL